VRPQPDTPRGGTEWILSAGLGFIPFVGELKDVQEAFTGVDLITGERPTIGERLLTGVLILFPFVGGSTLRGGLRAADELAGLVEAGAKRVSGGTRLERHHLLPREFKEYFEEGGLDIEDLSTWVLKAPGEPDRFWSAIEEDWEPPEHEPEP